MTVSTDSIKVGNAQVIGAREEQQDAFGFSDMEDQEFVQHGGVLAVVADGIGGHAHGGEASRMAVGEFLQDYMAKPKPTSIPDALYHALHAANRAVCEFAEAQGESKNCGTTLVAAVVHPGSLALYWISSGDSRLYLRRGKQWAQLTADCNYANQLLRKMAQGYLSHSELKPTANLQAITSFIGLKNLDEADRGIRPFKIHAGDQLVLCTDGVYNTLTTAELLECLQTEPQQACERLMQSVLAKGMKTQDNATASVLAYALTDTCTGEKPNQELGHEESPAPAPPPNDPDNADKTRSHFKLLLWLGVTLAVALAILLGTMVLNKRALVPSETGKAEKFPAASIEDPKAQTKSIRKK